MKYMWLMQPPERRIHPLVFVEYDGLCETDYELDGGWRCKGNGMLTVLRQLLWAGYHFESAKELPS